jgi:hypothetical protein
MGHVLILDSDPNHAAELAHELHAVFCRATVCSERRQVIETLRKEQVDIAILVSEAAADWESNAQWLRDAVSEVHHQDPPAVICALRSSYHALSERLFGARHGVRVIHEKR